MARLRQSAFWICLFSVLGAFLAGIQVHAAPGDGAHAALVLGPGCDPTRPAVAHHAGGVPLAPQPHGAPIACAVQVGPTTETATIGVTSNGTVFYAPLIGHPVSKAIDLSEPSMVARSRDDGATWTARDPASTPPDSSAVPWMHVDPGTSRVWYATVGFDPERCGKATIAHISWSDDGGQTWQSPRGRDCRQLQGGMSVVEGPAPVGSARPVGYPHVVYHCGNIQDGVSPLSTHCWKSLDGGETWSYVEGPNGATKCDNERPRGRAISPDGTFYMSIQCDAGIKFAISRDEGTHWQIQPAFKTARINRLDVSSLAVDEAGNIYITWVGGGPGGSRAPGRPYLIISRDGGTRWSDPLMVAAPGVNEVTEVGIAARKPGQVAISYLGSPDGGTHWNGYITESAHVLGTHPTFWSASVNNPRQPLMTGATGTSGEHGNRMWLITDTFGPDGAPWAAFHCAYTASCDSSRVGVVGRLVRGRPDAGQ